MKVAVCISVVPDMVSLSRYIDNNTGYRKNFIINPPDLYALNRAIFFKKQGASITVLSVGEKEIEPSLKKALAMGVDDVIRINPIDSIRSEAYLQLADYLKNNPYDLVLTGKESIDSCGGRLPSLLAASIDYGYYPSCVGIEVDSEMKASLQIDILGQKLQVEDKLPLLVVCKKGVVWDSDFLIPSMKSLMQANRSVILEKDIPVDLSRISFKNIKRKDIKKEVKLFDESDIDSLVEIIKKESC